MKSNLTQELEIMKVSKRLPTTRSRYIMKRLHLIVILFHEPKTFKILEMQTHVIRIHRKLPNYSLQILLT